MYAQLLPDGKTVMFTLSSMTIDASDLHKVRFETSEDKTLLNDAGAGRILPMGHLVVYRGGALWAVQFDARKPETIGAPIRVVEYVRVLRGGAVQYDGAGDGTLVFQAGATAGDRRSLQFMAGNDRVQPVPGTGARMPASDCRRIARASPVQVTMAMRRTSGWSTSRAAA